MSAGCISQLLQVFLTCMLTMSVVASSYVVVVKPHLDDLPVEPLYPYKFTKRAPAALKEGVNVCKTNIWKNHEPHIGHLANGSAVEIAQNEVNNFVMTVVECEGKERHQCNGVNHKEYASECFTHHEFYPAAVRLQGSTGPFVEGLLKVPIACMCRVRRLATLFR